jgi:hypothetical protein
MTGSAEIDGIGGRKARGIENQVLSNFAAERALGKLFRAKSFNVLTSRAVTRFAGDAERESRRIHTFESSYASRVTGKTAHHFGHRDRPRHRFIQIAGGRKRSCGGEMKIVEGAEERCTRLVPVVTALEEKRLTNYAQAKCPNQRSRFRMDAVGDCVLAVIAFSRDFVPILLKRKVKVRMLRENG